jgi:hypothetical protein
MKYWSEVLIQCEAKEVLNIECKETNKLKLLHEVDMNGNGGIFGLGGAPSPTLCIDKSDWVDGDKGWMVVQGGAGILLIGKVRFFCNKHKQAATTKLEELDKTARKKAEESHV